MAIRSPKKIREEYNSSRANKKDEITQEDIGKECGRHKSTVSRIENGHLKPTRKDLLAYCKLCHVSLDYILNDSIKAKEAKNARISEQLGITDAVSDTMVYIKNLSSDGCDYSAILNAFIGNGVSTWMFIDQIFSFLLSDYTNDKKNPTTDALMISNIMNYLENHVKPQLTDVLERRRQYVEYLDSIDSPKEPFNPSPDEYKAMMEEYNNNYKPKEIQ